MRMEDVSKQKFLNKQPLLELILMERLMRALQESIVT